MRILYNKYPSTECAISYAGAVTLNNLNIWQPLDLFTFVVETSK